MGTRTKQVLILLAILIALGAIAALVWPRHGDSASMEAGPIDGPMPSRNPMVTGAKVYGTIPMAPLTGRGIEDIRETLQAADIQDLAFASDGRGDELLDQVAEFLYYRFAQPSPQAYIDWRERRGYRWRKWAELNSVWTIDEAWKSFVGTPFPKDATMSERFSQLFDPVLDWDHAHNRPNKLASAPEGIAITSGVLTPGSPERDFVQGETGAELWHGKVASTACSWWDPPDTIDDLLAAGKKVDYAEVGMVLEFKDGSRHPVILTWFHHPSLDRWFLQHACHNNTDPNRLSAWYY